MERSNLYLLYFSRMIFSSPRLSAVVLADIGRFLPRLPITGARVSSGRSRFSIIERFGLHFRLLEIIIFLLSITNQRVDGVVPFEGIVTDWRSIARCLFLEKYCNRSKQNEWKISGRRMMYPEKKGGNTAPFYSGFERERSTEFAYHGSCSRWRAKRISCVAPLAFAVNLCTWKDECF